MIDRKLTTAKLGIVALSVLGFAVVLPARPVFAQNVTEPGVRSAPLVAPPKPKPLATPEMPTARAGALPQVTPPVPTAAQPSAVAPLPAAAAQAPDTQTPTARSVEGTLTSTPQPIPAAAEPPVLPVPVMDDILAPVAQAGNKMDQLEQQLERIKTSDAGLSDERTALETLIADSAKLLELVRPRIDASKTQLAQLGPAPKEDQPAEPQQIGAQRTRLTTILSTLEGAQKSTELVRVRATQLMARVQELRHGLFAANLFERTSSPLLPAIWLQINSHFAAAENQLQTVFGTWVTIVKNNQHSGLIVLGLTLAAYCLSWLITRRPLMRLLPSDLPMPPTYTTRASAASLAALLYAIPAIAAACVLYYGATATNLIYYRVAPLSLDVFQGLVLMAVVSALARAILEPQRPIWRLMNLSDTAATSLLGSVMAIAAVYAIDQVLIETIRALLLPLPFNVVLSFVTSLAFAALLLRVVATPFEPAASALPEFGTVQTASEGSTSLHPARASRTRPRWLKAPLLVVAIAIVAAALAGYVALSRFAAGQVVITGSAAVLVVLIHLAIQTIEAAIVSPLTLLGGWMTHGIGIEERQRQMLARIVSVLLHAVLAIVAVPALLLAWGFSVQDVATGLKTAMFGFEIGSTHISLARILIAIGLFLALLFSTRLLQRWLQSGPLRSDKMDPGIANSIHQGVGYAGFSLATLGAIAAGGIDITNLAIVAGALSVGIGFGLQSIVNNFVSGLILLVERPIKVGDWIVLRGGGEGFVRSISVRSTEIETFDRSSLIVPNSELISNVVTNWTHRNALGRVIVKVNASYKSDPEDVLRVLEAVAKTCPGAMQHPAPFVSFDNLGADGLEFSIGVVIADVTKGGDVRTALRTGVFKAFAAHAIEFPTVERDIYLRDLDGVKVLIARVLEERARENASSSPPTVDGIHRAM